MQEEATPSSERELAPAVLRGLACRCPACGKAPLFAGFLKPVAACPACMQDWSHQRADDFPAYLVVLLLGHLLVPLVIEANRLLPLSALTQMIGWPVLAVMLALLLIQPAKGAVIGLQWARRMHGFGAAADSGR